MILVGVLFRNMSDDGGADFVNMQTAEAAA
jgi:hypothetical protein